MLKGSSMVYAMVIALLVALLTSSFILLAHFDTTRTDRWLAQQRALSNAERALTLVRAKVLKPALEVRWFDLGQGVNDSVLVRSIPWGLWDRVSCQARVHDRSADVSALIGRSSSTNTVLELTDRSGPLHLCGDARIKGDIRTAMADVRRGLIEGRPSSASPLVNGSIQQLNGPGSAIDKDLMVRMLDLCAMKKHELAAAVVKEELSFADDLVELNTIPVLDLPNGYRLSDLAHDGPLIVQCVDTLIIASDFHSEDVLIQAAFIQIGSGARMSGQFFATNGIEVEHDVELIYPSALVVNMTDGSSGIVLHERVAVHGVVVALVDDPAMQGKVCVSIAPGAQVIGELHTEGMVQHQGVVQGRIVAAGFFLRTASSAYRGYLLDAVISPYPHPFESGISVTSTSSISTIMKWY